MISGKTSSAVILWFVSSSLFSCKHNDLERQSVVFENYLIEHHNTQLSANRHVYVVVPRQGCFGCMQRILMALNNYQQKSITYIVSNRNENVKAAIPDQAIVWSDSMGYVDRLDLEMVGLKILKSTDGKIIANKYFYPDSLHQLHQFVKPYLK